AAINERVNVRKTVEPEPDNPARRDHSVGTDWGNYMGERPKRVHYDQHYYDPDLSDGYSFHQKDGNAYELHKQTKSNGNLPLPARIAKVVFKPEDLRAGRNLKRGNAAVNRGDLAEAWLEFGATWKGDTRKHKNPENPGVHEVLPEAVNHGP